MIQDVKTSRMGVRRPVGSRRRSQMRQKRVMACRRLEADKAALGGPVTRCWIWKLELRAVEDGGAVLMSQ